MALTSWKEFPFFEVSQVRLEGEDGADALSRDNTSCVVAGSNNVLVGTPDGTVNLLDQTFKAVRSWKAHDAGRVTNLHQVPDTSYLVTLAEDLAHEPELKVWSLDQTEKKTGHPKCLCSLIIQNGKKNFPVTAFSVTTDLTQLAVGFGNGAVTVVRGDFIHDRGTRQRTVFESGEPITGLEFREGNTTALFIATTTQILVLAITGNRQGTAARKMDDQGCAVDCMTLDRQSNEIVVARDDGIYAYGPRGKAAPYPYEVPKKLVRVCRDYVLVVSPPNDSFARSAPQRAFGATQIFNNSAFIILYTDLRLIAHNQILQNDVSSILCIWGDIYLLTIDGKLHRYHEKTFQQKLDILYQRKLYVYAIDLAQKYKVDVGQKNAIFRRYGDFLYQKGEYDTAMQQYLRAIDNTEPSQIIRKFLDKSITNLIEYLEELHEHGKATSDHTTLLLNCYAKLKDVHKLEEFIRQPGELKFELDAAIVMCRQAGYYDQAAFLARRHNEHGLVVDILIEDLKKYHEAMAYIVRLEPQLAYESLLKYGTVLLEHCSRDATQLFIDYFTGQFRPKKDAVIVQEAPATQEGSGGFGNMAQSAVQNLAALIPLPYMNATASQPAAAGESAKTTVSQVVETTKEDDFVAYEVPKPRIAFSSFVDHPDEFVVFLEALTGSEDVRPENKTDLYTTLFEMYLHKASSSKAEEKTEWERKARGLIEAKDVPIDTSNILLLSDLEKFRDGTILVSEKRGLRFDVFRSYTSAHDTAGAIKALHKYGPEEPQLYPAALAYFTSSPEILEEAGSEVEAVLKRIESGGLMGPLQVIQTLSTNAVATMGLVKKYLSSTVEKERSEIDANRRLISSYRSDTAKKLSELNELSTKPTSFSATRCSTCGSTLDLPTVHFLCKHSFHQRCLNVADSEVDDVNCPICAPQNETMRQIRQAQQESAHRNDLFTTELGMSADRFGTVSDWFNRGVMGVAGGAAE